MNRTCRTLITVAFAAAVMPSSALAAPRDGGAAFPAGKPAVDGAQCAGGEQWRCKRGEVLTLSGNDLDIVKSILFLGGKGRRDDRKVRPQRTAEHELLVTIPADAKSGPLRARDGRRTIKVGRTLKIVKGPVTPPAPLAGSAATVGDEGIFPISGPHDMGQSATNRFGGARNHGGQDLFAECGTPLVAVRPGVVQLAKFQDRAGNYVVLQAVDGQSYAYMHMLKPSPLKTGDVVAAGQPVGAVGQTGRATGCHLHFEQWTAPGWYTGGKAIDPMPQLRRWEAAPHSHAE